MSPMIGDVSDAVSEFMQYRPGLPPPVDATAGVGRKRRIERTGRPLQRHSFTVFFVITSGGR